MTEIGGQEEGQIEVLVGYYDLRCGNFSVELSDKPVFSASVMIDLEKD